MRKTWRDWKGHGLLLGLVLFMLVGCATQPAAEPKETSATEPAPAMSEPVPSAGLPLDQQFWQTWGDGQAELSSYALKTPRYGSLREGTAVAIFVTETFSEEARVKADPGKHPASDEFPVMKLNLVEDFPTGIYDYNLMTSTFVALKPFAGLPAGQTAKVSFSAQEWCGHAWHQVTFGQHGAKSVMHSYFDGEADRTQDLPSPRNGLSEDALLHWARGMAGPRLKPGETLSVPMLLSLRSARLEHKPLGWRQATLSRAAQPETISVPAGTFDADVYTVRVQGGSGKTFYVEQNAPHRVLRWTTDSGEQAELIGSQRMKYWQMNDPASSVKLGELGLFPRPGRTM